MDFPKLIGRGSLCGNIRSLAGAESFLKIVVTVMEARPVQEREPPVTTVDGTYTLLSGVGTSCNYNFERNEYGRRSGKVKIRGEIATQ